MNIQRLQALRASKGYHILPIKPGMQLELHEEIGEGSNKRIWRFKGLVIKVVKPKHADGTFTIRGKTAGHTIEKIYPLSFPNFKKVILLDEYRIRRAKLYYIRDKVGKDARMTSILSKSEKNIDLLALALEESEALKKAYEEMNNSESLESSESSEENSEVKKEVKDEVKEEMNNPENSESSENSEEKEEPKKEAESSEESSETREEVKDEVKEEVNNSENSESSEEKEELKKETKNSENDLEAKEK